MGRQSTDTFVLVHGSFHGGWCWQRVADLLRGLGHTVFAPTLTGLGERAHLVACVAGLTTHVRDIQNLLFFEDLSDVVLVGHSYAGMVVTGVAMAAPDRVRRLVYLDAYVPDPGQSWFDVQTPADAAQAREAMRRDHGLRTPPPATAFGITDADVAWVDARLTPQPQATYEEPIAADGRFRGDLDVTYVHCVQGPWASRFAPSAAKARARGWRVHELAAGHDAMLAAPGEVARLLVGMQEQQGPRDARIP